MLRALLLLPIILFSLLWSTGTISFNERGYECVKDKMDRKEAVPVLDLDGFQINAHPLVSECVNDLRIYYDEEGNYIPQSELTDEQLQVQ